MKLKALREFRYAGVLRRPGDVFETETDKHALLLKAGRRAVDAPGDAPVTPPKALSPPAPSEPAQSGLGFAGEGAPVGGGEGKRRYYRRRDVVAES